MGLWWATTNFGLLGAITVTVGVIMIERVIIGIKLFRLLKISRKDAVLFKDIGKLAVAAILAGAVTALARLLIPGAKPLVVLVVSGFCFAAAYALAALLLGVLRPGERKALLRRISKAKGLLRAA